jgi:hypothetical protein
MFGVMDSFVGCTLGNQCPMSGYKNSCLGVVEDMICGA